MPPQNRSWKRHLKGARSVLCVVSALTLWPGDCRADQATSTGSAMVTVIDPSGAAVAHASMLVTRDASGEGPWPVSSESAGVFVARNLPAGRYRIRLEAAGFEPVTIDNVRVTSGEETRRTVRLTLERVAETVVVGRDAQRDAIDPRGFSTFLSREQIDALPDDPESFARALQALAPPGAVIRIDGFTGGSLPPKSQILSIRIPRFDTFAAQDHGGLDGLSFIDLVTRPGGGRLAGSADASFRSHVLDARNPLSMHEGHTSMRAGTLALDGPIVRDLMSFSLAARGAGRDETTTVHAALPGGVVVAEPVTRPQDAFTLSGRVATALGPRHSLRVSFVGDRQTARHLGVGGPNLPERAYATESSELTLRAAAGGPLGRRGLFEIRTQIRRSGTRVGSSIEAPTIHVLDAFSAGGAQVQGGNRALDLETAVDVDYARRAHAARFGALVEHESHLSRRAANYLGTYTFASLTDFVEDRPAFYTRRFGDPAVSFSSSRIGLYAQDDWRAARSVLVSAGLRAELQTTVSGGAALLPRAAVSWSPFRTGKTTIRAGWGIFADWLSDSVYEQSLVVNGERQHDVRLPWPAYPASTADVLPAPRERYSIADDLHLPGAWGLAIGVEHQIAASVRVYASYSRRIGNELLRGRNLNAPIDGIRPDPSFANVIEARSDASSRSGTLTLQAVTSDPRRRAEFAVVYSFTDGRANTTGPFTVGASGERLDLEWGPTSPRHVAAGTLTARVPGNLSFAVSPRWRSGTPYTLTTGRDDNRDGLFTDRPPGVARNSARTPPQWELGVRVSFVLRFGTGDGPSALPSAGADSESLRAGAVARDRGDSSSRQGRCRLELFASAQNVTNHANYTALGGVLGSPFFGKPTSASPARTIDVGVRFGF